ncbi:MAG: hypothetical protein RLZZ44_874 [Bacteroidota bacterium]
MVLFSLLSWSLNFLGYFSSSQIVTPYSNPNLPIVLVNNVEYWITNESKNAYLQKQTAILSFGSVNNNYPIIEVNDAQTFQTIDGFGFTLTGEVRRRSIC